MNLLIIWKWIDTPLMVWVAGTDGNKGNYTPDSPGIISTMINMFLKFGSVVTTEKVNEVIL